MLKEKVRSYENGLMVSALKKVADGKPRTPLEIANITGLSLSEVESNFYNMSKDDYTDSHPNARCRSRFHAIQYKFEIIRSKQRIERKYVAIDENGRVDLKHPLTHTSCRTTYIITRK